MSGHHEPVGERQGRQPAQVMRLAYADPPYPGKAHLYPENTEVDHVELIDRLQEYDGWALSTDERSLHYVLGLCPTNVRVLAWCRTNAPPFFPNPVASWEPVVIVPARTRTISSRSFLVDAAVVAGHKRAPIPGQKTAGFCEWILRCLGAESDDSMTDMFPGSGIMGQVFDSFRAQLSLVPLSRRGMGYRAEENRRRRTHDPLPGMERSDSQSERGAERGQRG